VNAAKLVGIVLIVAGGLGLLYGGFSYTRETHSAQIGPLVLNVQEKETVYVPVIVSGASVGLGLFLLLGLKNK
jgi:hypothetical protein